MHRPNIVRLRAATLLMAVALWLVNVTLCCQVVAQPAPVPTAPLCHGHTGEDEPAPAGDGHHAEGACCVGIKAFPAQGTATDLTAAAPAVWVPIAFLTWTELRQPQPAAIAIRAQVTGPPGRSPLLSLVLRSCLPGRAPPTIA